MYIHGQGLPTKFMSIGSPQTMMISQYTMEDDLKDKFSLYKFSLPVYIPL